MALVLDAMGSDRHPVPEIEAAIAFAKETNEKIYLVGNRDVVFSVAKESDFDGLPIEFVHAEDVLDSDAKAVSSFKEKPNNSMAVGLRLVREGKAEGFLTNGSTGAALFAALRILGRIKNVSRPCLATFFPTQSDYCVLLDIGANSDCRPDFLHQFATMGAVYAEKMLGVKEPKIGLLSNGEEESKGNEIARETFKLLSASSRLNFYGNIEPKEVFAHKVDVVVTDGFTGNVFMKTTEAAAKMITDMLKTGFMSTPLTKIGALLNKSTLSALKVKVDPEKIGAAPLLGVDGLACVGHGRSNANATIGGLRRLREAADSGLVDEIRRRIPLELSTELGE